MVQLVFEQAISPGFVERFQVQVSHDEALKREVYELRSRAAFSERPHQSIDPYDAISEHLVLRDLSTQTIVCATRLIPKPERLPQDLPLEQHLSQNKISERMWSAVYGDERTHVVSELSERHVLPESELAEQGAYDASSLTECTVLASCALARLLFHEVMLCELSLEEFKRFRARGLMFEYLSAASSPDAETAVFYLDLNRELPQSSLYYPLFHLFSDQIAPQLNMPGLSERSMDEAN